MKHFSSDPAAKAIDPKAMIADKGIWVTFIAAIFLAPLIETLMSKRPPAKRVAFFSAGGRIKRMRSIVVFRERRGLRNPAANNPWFPIWLAMKVTHRPVVAVWFSTMLFGVFHLHAKNCAESKTT